MAAEEVEVVRIITRIDSSSSSIGAPLSMLSMVVLLLMSGDGWRTDLFLTFYQLYITSYLFYYSFLVIGREIYLLFCVIIQTT